MIPFVCARDISVYKRRKGEFLCQLFPMTARQPSDMPISGHMRAIRGISTSRISAVIARILPHRCCLPGQRYKIPRPTAGIIALRPIAHRPGPVYGFWKRFCAATAAVGRLHCGAACKLCSRAIPEVAAFNVNSASALNALNF